MTIKHAVLVAGLGAFISMQATAAPGTVDIQVLAVNDFHGNLVPPAGSSGRVGAVNAGGAGYLATHLAGLRELNPNTAVALEKYFQKCSPVTPGPMSRITLLP